MNHISRPTSRAIGFYVLAALLLANLVATLVRSDGPAILPAALAQRQAPIAGGAGLYVMPAQVGANQWGCYLMDVDRGTLCVYQYYPGTKQLELTAARNFTNDTKLGNFNTMPPPAKVADLVTKQNQALRGAAPAGPGPVEPAGRGDN